MATATSVAMAPRLIILLSGKRKCGKDHVAELLASRFADMSGAECCIVRVSAPLKQQYAQQHNLHFERTLTSDGYKETHRHDMIAFGEHMRRTKGNGYFCELAIGMADPERRCAVWIVSDCRRPGDIEYFDEFVRHNQQTTLFKMRLHASDAVRESRGWTFVAGIDDAESECALDTYSSWHYHIHNDTQQQLDECLREIMADLDVILKRDSLS